MLAVKVDIETAPCYDETSIEKGRGLGTLTTLRPTLNRPTFLGQPISHRFILPFWLNRPSRFLQRPAHLGRAFCSNSDRTA